METVSSWGCQRPPDAFIHGFDRKTTAHRQWWTSVVSNCATVERSASCQPVPAADAAAEIYLQSCVSGSRRTARECDDGWVKLVMTNGTRHVIVASRPTAGGLRIGDRRATRRPTQTHAPGARPTQYCSRRRVFIWRWSRIDESRRDATRRGLASFDGGRNRCVRTDTYYVPPTDEEAEWVRWRHPTALTRRKLTWLTRRTLLCAEWQSWQPVLSPRHGLSSTMKDALVILQSKHIDLTNRTQKFH